MKRKIIFIAMLMILLITTVSSIHIDENDEHKTVPIKKLSELESKVPTQAQKGLLTAEANLLWKSQLGFNQFKIINYKEYNNHSIIYVELIGVSKISCSETPNCGEPYIQGNKEKCDCSWKWQTGTQRFNEIISG